MELQLLKKVLKFSSHSSKNLKNVDATKNHFWKLFIIFFVVGPFFFKFNCHISASLVSKLIKLDINCNLFFYSLKYLPFVLNLKSNSLTLEFPTTQTSLLLMLVPRILQMNLAFKKRIGLGWKINKAKKCLRSVGLTFL